MHEVFEVTLKIVLLIGLFYIAWFDYRTKLIEAKWLWIIGVFGVVLLLLHSGIAIVGQVFAGTLPGWILLMLAWVSGESVGFGDGWLFVVTGIFLGWKKNAVLLLGSLIFAGVFAIVCLVLKKKEKNDRIALAPFVLAAYVGVVL